MLGVNDEFAIPVTANNTQDPEASATGSWFDTLGWQSTAQNLITGVVAGKINKQYGLNLGNNIPFTRAPNGQLVQQGGTAAYGIYESGAIGNTLMAAGWVQQNWPLLLGAGVVVAFMLLRK
jgi:hypothetical protein